MPTTTGQQEGIIAAALLRMRAAGLTRAQIAAIVADAEATEQTLGTPVSALLHQAAERTGR